MFLVSSKVMLNVVCMVHKENRRTHVSFLLLNGEKHPDFIPLCFAVVIILDDKTTEEDYSHGENDWEEIMIFLNRRDF